ncbi:unnamed protein product, partial [Meganyctiphanes norvegica]
MTVLRSLDRCSIESLVSHKNIFKAPYTLFAQKLAELQSHPNVMLIIVDDLRPGIGCYGDILAKTPNIDALARRGIVFNKAYAQQALCGPSRTSFLTSRRPDTTHIYDVHYYWRNHAGNFTTLPQFFKEHGFHTVNAGKVFHPGISSNHNDDQPYSWSEEPYHPSSQAHKQDPVCMSKDGYLHTNIYCPVVVEDQPEKTLPDIQTQKFALDWLHKRSQNPEKEPFFLAIGFHKPHIPLKFPIEYLDMFPIDEVPLVPDNFRPQNVPLVSWNPYNDLRRRYDISQLNVSFPFGPLNDSYARYIRQGYYASVTYIDDLIGDLIKKLDKLFPNTIITLIGDHGWSLGEHDEWSKYSNYEVATRVPFIISLPQVMSAKLHNYGKFKTCNTFTNVSKRKKSKYNSDSHCIYNGVVELVDLFPTLADLAGLPALDRCTDDSKNEMLCTEGVSLAPIINHSSNYSSKLFINKKIAISQYPRPGINPTINPDSDQPKLTETIIMGYTLRSQRYRYTLWLGFNHTSFEVNWQDDYGEELYDHKIDPRETFNLAQKNIYLQKKRKLKRYLNK